MKSAAASDIGLSVRTAFAYGFLALPLAFAGLPLYIHIPDFYTREMGLGLASAGIILMFLRLLDAVQDPVIGYISDKGPAFSRAVMLLGLSALLAGMGALLIGPPDFLPVAYWFAGGVGLTALGLSMVNINLVMIGSLHSRDKFVQNRLSGMREGMSLLGMLLASILPGFLMMFMIKPDAFQIFYVIFAITLLLSAAAFLYFYKKSSAICEISSIKTKQNSPWLPCHFFRNNSGFLSACFLTHIAASFPAILFLYFVTDYLGAGDKAGFFLFIYFLSGAIFMPLWLKISTVYSREQVWLLSILVAVGSFIWAFNLGPGDLIQFGVICMLSGSALGADLAFPPVIMAKRLQVQGAESYATQAYAILNLIPKIALGIATGISFLALQKSGFSPSALNNDGSMLTLICLYALIPCLIKAISGLIIFNLHNGVTHEIQKRSSSHGHTYGA